MNKPIKYMTQEEQDEFWEKHRKSKERLLERISFGLGEFPDHAYNIFGIRKGMPKVYVSSVYGKRHGLSSEEYTKNTWKAIELGRELILRGFNPFIPHLWHFIAEDMKGCPDEEVWFQLVAEWIEDCDCLLVGEMPLWANSGVEREITIARSLSKPIFYTLESLMRRYHVAT